MSLLITRLTCHLQRCTAKCPSTTEERKNDSIIKRVLSCQASAGHFRQGKIWGFAVTHQRLAQHVGAASRSVGGF
ncbi:uncharacterized protein B0T23DRAFT_382350 [Neurospora hispaniola]|uniref:Uncharacterized protein n=1 Tax=Neurospora hispaniola TaxID=588809 RepID=A0AAJ0I679_9PEZI|nr:hypothetical protein B0T23DRAFT_382350 [Neurospora hispaniola]